MSYGSEWGSVSASPLCGTVRALPIVVGVLIASGCGLTQAPPPPSVDVLVRLHDSFGSLPPGSIPLPEDPCELEVQWIAVVIKSLDASGDIVGTRARATNANWLEKEMTAAGAGICRQQLLFESVPVGAARVVVSNEKTVRVCNLVDGDAGEGALTDQGPGVHEVELQVGAESGVGCTVHFQQAR